MYRPRIWSKDDSDVMTHVSIHADVPCTSIYSISTRPIEQISEESLWYLSDMDTLLYGVKSNRMCPVIAEMIAEAEADLVGQIHRAVEWLKLRDSVKS